MSKEFKSVVKEMVAANKLGATPSSPLHYLLFMPLS